jgi:hypothetical protein
MKNLGLILAATILGGVSVSAPSLAQDRGYYVRHTNSLRTIANWEQRHAPVPLHDEFNFGANGG